MNTTDILEYGHKTILEAIEDLPESHWEQSSVCGEWSVKDVIAHLGSCEHLLVDILNSLQGESSTPTLDLMLQDYEKFNDNQVIQRRGFSVQATLDEYITTQAQTIDLITGIPLETQRSKGLLPWYGAAYDLQDFIVYTYYGHKREHAAQIAVFRDQL